LGWQEKSERRFNNQPPGMRKSLTLFGIDRFPEGEIAILVESPLDAVRLHHEGYEGAVSSYGVRVSEAQMRLIVERTDDVLVALDDDEEGRVRGAELGWEPISDRVRTRTLDYSRCSGRKDVGEMTSEEIHAAIRGSRLLVRSAVPSLAGRRRR
jgi:hypothetical protein